MHDWCAKMWMIAFSVLVYFSCGIFGCYCWLWFWLSLITVIVRDEWISFSSFILRNSQTTISVVPHIFISIAQPEIRSIPIACISPQVRQYCGSLIPYVTWAIIWVNPPSTCSTHHQNLSLDPFQTQSQSRSTQSPKQSDDVIACGKTRYQPWKTPPETWSPS